MKMAAVVTLVYGLLVFAGGIMGYVQAKSLPSLISGIVFGLVLLVCGWFTWGGSGAAVYVSIAAALILALFFAYRFTSTGRFMPGGLMFLLSFIAVVILVVGVFRSLRA